MVTKEGVPIEENVQIAEEVIEQRIVQAKKERKITSKTGKETL